MNYFAESSRLSAIPVAMAAGSPPAEQRQRLESLAARYKDGLPPDELRLRRAVQALRWYGDTEAKKLLAEGAPLTEAARAALEAME